MGDINRLLNNYTSILNLYQASKYHIQLKSKGKVGQGHRLITTTPAHNVFIGPQDLRNRQLTDPDSVISAGTETYVNYLFSNQNDILTLFRNIKMAREQKGKGKCQAFRFNHTFDDATTINQLYTGTGLMDLEQQIV
jgi:hypothetical protein